MAKKQTLSKTKIQILAYERLLAIADDPETSAAVKVQALTQLAKLADQLQTDEVDELEAFLNER